MALTEAQKISLAQILNKTYLEVDWQVNYMGVILTDGKITAIIAQIALWNAGAGTKTTKLFPVESNKGIKTDPDAVRSDIRRSIAVLLERPDWGMSGNYLPRG